VSDVDEATVTVVAGGSGGDGNPFTGFGGAGLLAWAAALVVLGSIVLAASRKREETRP
jgi:hypothetical protein